MPFTTSKTLHIVACFLLIFQTLCLAQKLDSVITCSGSSSYAQIQLSDIEDPNYPEPNKYYKDSNNLLDSFVGTFLYSNGSTSFEIKLEKKINSSVNNGIYFEDLLIGAYRYVENGVEKVNTLNDLDNNIPNGSLNPISGNGIMRGKVLGQDDAAPNEAWIYASIKDPISDTSSKLFIRKIMINGQEAIKIGVYFHHIVRDENDPEPVPNSFPSEEFILIKQ